LYSSSQRTKKRKQILADVAQQLGLMYIDNANKFASSTAPEMVLPPTPPETDATPYHSGSRYHFDDGSSTKPIPTQQQTETATKWLSIFSSFLSQGASVKGNYQRVPIDIHFEDRGSKSKTTYTCFKASITPSLGIGLNISKENFFKKIGHNLFHMQDIDTGNQTLDQTVTIKGENEDAVKQLLGNSTVQTSIETAIKKLAGVKILDDHVYYEEATTITDIARYKDIVQTISSVASALQSPDRV
jgi:hypothetical protein